jgi:ribose transport system ATP-binding protein
VLLIVRDVSKRFPGVQALERVSLCANQGEVLAVVGENGAGKSTLMKIVGGIYEPDEGTIEWEGRSIRLPNVTAALRRGISLIHQELNLAENLSVIDNLFLGREEHWGGPLRFLNRARMKEAARRLLDRVGLHCPVNTRVSSLAPGQQQLVEIARALAMHVRLLIMDEPTSSLTQQESEMLFGVIAALKHEGVAILYISHRLAEVTRIADRVVVLRDGRNAGELERTQISHDAMVRLMVGRELKQFYRRTAGRTETTKAVLEVRGLRYAGGPNSTASFHVNVGEIVGMAGLVGAGRTELAEALFGVRRVTSGNVQINGVPLNTKGPRQAVRSGLFLVPEDRRHHGLVLEENVQRNIGLPNLDLLSYLRFISGSRERRLAGDTCQRLRVRTPSLHQTVSLLSGGNQQKIVLGKWLVRKPRVLILDEPTRGIDVGSKSEIYELMEQLTREGVAILMISSDLEEIIGMSDRVLVLHQGEITGEVSRAQISEEAIMRLATGLAGRLIA